MASDRSCPEITRSFRFFEKCSADHEIRNYDPRPFALLDQKASANFTADDKCDGPQAALVSAEHALDAAKVEFSGAFAKFTIDPAQSSVAQHWLCDQGGSLGPDADEGARKVVVGTDQMIMGRYDGVVLLVEKVGG